MADVMCLIAPTASGKTALAYELYDTGNYYLISVDSALIYRDMTIGTAKPTADELARYPHALVDILDPTQQYSVAQFVSDVRMHIAIAHHQGKTPLLVGGTMMYYMALIEGIADIPATEPATRNQVQAMIAEQGIEAVYAQLQGFDPVLASRFHATDTQRIGRAMEVYLQTGRALSDWQNQPNIALAQQPEFNWHIIAVMPDRAWLHERIAKRLAIMWQAGLVEEVQLLQQTYPLHADMPSMRCVGYRQVWAYLTQLEQLQSQHTFNATTQKQAYTYMQDTALFTTRQLAKRQYTWLRKLIALPDLPTNIHINAVQSIDEAKQTLLK